MLKMALSHDVDRTKKSYQYLSGFAKGMMKGNFSQALYHITPPKKEPYWDVYEIMDIEKSFGVKSTFFILDESIKFNPLKPDTFVLAFGRYDMFEPKIQEAIRHLDKSGWEIGLHGSFLSYNNKELLSREKNRLESIVRHPVLGIRQHHLNLDDSTWKIQEDLGFVYDSTWGSNFDIGYKDGKIKPFNPTGTNFKVFPLSLMDICFVPLKNKWEQLERLMDETEQNDAVLVVNYHHGVYNEKDHPGYRSSYIKIIESALKRNAEIAPLIKFYNKPA